MRPGRILGLFVLAAAVIGITIWLYGFPAGYQACRDLPDRGLYTQYLSSQGLRVECRKETGTRDMIPYRMQTISQFAEWTRTYQVGTVYEQPGYFWFTANVPAFGEGYVYYEYR